MLVTRLREALEDRDIVFRSSGMIPIREPSYSWRFLTLKDTWKAELFRTPDVHLERLGLMRKPSFWKTTSSHCSRTPTEELGITRDEHVNMMIAAATNLDLIGSSRWHGRAPFKGYDWSEPSEQFGQMWDACLTLWADHPRVAYFFFRYIQTVPEKKLAVYRSLWEQNAENFWDVARPSCPLL